MNKRLSLITGILITFFLSFHPNQTLKGQVKSSDYFFKKADNHLKYFFDKDGNVTLKSYCDFYRSIKYPIKTFPFSDEIIDYYLNGQMAFKGSVKNGLLDGNAEYYYNSGILKINGRYKEGIRHGLWEFYYPNGNIEKKIRYGNEKLYIIEFYRRNGKQLVINGNGKFRGKAFLGPNHDLIYQMSGKVHDSLMNGKWKIGTEIEEYKNGELLNGYGSCLKGFYNPYVHEKLNIFTSILYTEASANKPVYNKTETTTDFLNDLINEVSQISIEKKLETHWSLISFKISEENKIMYIDVVSSEEVLEIKIRDFINSSSWNSAIEITKECITIKIKDPINVTTEEIREELENIKSEDFKNLKITKKGNIDCYFYIPIVSLEDQTITLKLSAKKFNLNKN